mmetsp:Transcript_11901/g.25490  ORF Transcript_11901/g.25490 Transcript_11901/m.25490 type:complete len:230 (-) Transcript_11901:12-701(-)
MVCCSLRARARARGNNRRSRTRASSQSLGVPSNPMVREQRSEGRAPSVRRKGMRSNCSITTASLRAERDGKRWPSHVSGVTSSCSKSTSSSSPTPAATATGLQSRSHSAISLHLASPALFPTPFSRLSLHRLENRLKPTVACTREAAALKERVRVGVVGLCSTVSSCASDCTLNEDRRRAACSSGVEKSSCFTSASTSSSPCTWSTSASSSSITPPNTLPCFFSKSSAM